MSKQVPYRIHLFARARELAGADVVTVSCDPAPTVVQLRLCLTLAFPALASIVAHSAMAVNQEFAPENMVVEPADEIALIPPVSGGGA